MAISLQFLYLDHSKTYLEGPPLLSANHGFHRQVASQESLKKNYIVIFSPRKVIIFFTTGLSRQVLLCNNLVWLSLSTVLCKNTIIHYIHLKINVLYGHLLFHIFFINPIYSKWTSELNSKWAINSAIAWREQVTFYDMIMMSALYYTNTLSWIFIVLSHRNKSPLGHIILILIKPVFCSYSLILCA